MIEDDELRKLFEAESEEHLQKLEDGFLQLEKHADNPEVLKELFREAHSLKGAARMLGVDAVETLAHRLEDILGVACRKGELEFSPELVDQLTRGLDDIRVMVREAVTGESAGISLFDALQRLSVQAQSTNTEPSESVTPAVAPLLVEPPRPQVVTPAVTPLSVESSPPQVVTGSLLEEPPRPQVVTPAVAVLVDAIPRSVERLSKVATPPVAKVQTSPESGAEPVENHPFEASSSQIKESVTPDLKTAGEVSGTSVIRVDSSKLDLLLNLVGELTVVRTRVKRRLSEIEETIVVWEELAREMRAGSNDGVGLSSSGECDQTRSEQLGVRLHELRSGIFADEVALDGVARELEAGIHNLRLLPLFSLFSLFPRMVRDLARQQSKQVALTIEGGETTADKRIIEEMKSPLMHLVRNAIDHGQESSQERLALGKPVEGSIRMRAFRTATHVVIEVIDDGRGLDLAAIRRGAVKRHLVADADVDTLSDAQVSALIFQSGFSTSAMVTDVSGRGVGLDVVRVNIERLKGSVQVASESGKGCCFTIRLPITLATTPVFVVAVGEHHFAIPLDCVHSVRRVTPQGIFPIEGRDAIVMEGAPVSVAHLADLLEIPLSVKERSPPPWSCIVLMVGEERVGIFVDALLDELEVVMKPHGGILTRVRNISGATILGTGEVCMVLNPQDLIKTVQKPGFSTAGSRAVTSEDVVERTGKKTILLAEDSITTRIQEKRILEGAGYDVIVAVDGADAYNKLGHYSFDAVVSDVQMPNLDGLGLTTKIRQNAAYKDLPVMLVTSLASDEDLHRGLEAGANAYITKPTFDQAVFLETLRRLV